MKHQTSSNPIVSAVHPHMDWGTFPEIGTPRDVAMLLRLSLNTTYSLLSRREIPGKKVGASWRVSRDSLRRFIESGE